MFGIGIAEFLVIAITGLFVVGCLGLIFLAVFTAARIANKDNQDDK